MNLRKSLKDITAAFVMIISYIVCFYLQLIFSTSEPFGNTFAHLQALICLIATYYYAFNGFKIICIINTVKIILLLLNFYCTHNIFMFTYSQIEIITLISTFIISYTRTHQLVEIEKQKKLTSIDDVTQTYNRHFFEYQLHNEIINADIAHSNVGLIFINIDTFKLRANNSKYDYIDNVLVSISKHLKDITSPEYFICRYSNNQFAIIIPNIDIHSLESFSIHFKNSVIENQETYIPNSLKQYIDLSMGLSVYPYMANDFSSLIQQTEIALYHAKNSGHNMLYIYQDFLLQLESDIVLENKHLISIFKALLTCLSTRDPYSLGHCKRVAAYASNLAHYLGLSLNETNTLYYAGLLHDIGKIEIPMTILNKNNELTQEEFNIIKMHPIYGANILEPLSDMYELVDYVRHHHERFDGQGYPDKLSGSDISLGARILAVVDAYDAMISERPYSKCLSVDAALAEISRYSGNQFDPYIANAFIEMISQNTDTSKALYTNNLADNSHSNLKTT